MAKVDLTQFNRQLAQAEKAVSTLPQYAEQAMRNRTPKDTGNARRNTKLQGNTVQADYPYAERLENNWSKQTHGQGIVAPTLKDIQQEVDRRLKGI